METEIFMNFESHVNGFAKSIDIDLNFYKRILKQIRICIFETKSKFAFYFSNSECYYREQW